VFHVKLDPFLTVETLPAPEQAKIRAYEDLLRTRAAELGLIGSGESRRIRDRHILDSMRGLSCLGIGKGQVVDMGSGGGLPGIPLAIADPTRPITLVDRRRKATAFLELVVEELSLANVRVVFGQLEALQDEADVCLARALAPPEAAWALAARLLGPRGHLVYWAGRGWSPSGPASAAVVVSEICVRPLFSWQGPVVIMRRP
jgi:16S rRNA (guanine527-N7)-methyltransferase